MKAISDGRNLDLVVPRNAFYAAGWQLFDDVDDVIDLTGCVIGATARTVAGGTIIASADIDLHTPAEGRFDMRWDGADFDGVLGVMEVVYLAYDLKIIYPDAVSDILARGRIILVPEATP